MTFVRLCPRHGAPVRFRLVRQAETPWCSAGRHVPDGWAVVDIARPAVWAAATLDAVCLGFDLERLPVRPVLAAPRGQLAAP